MKSTYLRIYTVAALIVCAVVLLLAPDPAAAAGMLLLANAPAAVEMEVLQKALADHGIAWKSFMEKQTDVMGELKARMFEVEQRLAGGALPGGDPSGGDPLGALVDLMVKDDHVKAFASGKVPSAGVQVPSHLVKALKAVIVSSSTLVNPQRMPGIITAPQRRFYIRELLPNVTISSGSVESVKETLFTNNAGPQYDTSSPTPGQEGAVKPESAATFELVTNTVTTLAHWIPASRQVLADAPMLRQYLDTRLRYGLALEEDDQLLNGNNANGSLNGLKNQDTTFTGGATNATALDSVARGIGQLAATDYMATGIILHPGDWWSSAFVLAKDSQNRYMLGDPAQMTEPRLWGIPVAVTSTQAQGEFTVLDGQRAGFVADREDAVIRVSEHHQDYFVRNLVAILCEERLALVVEQGGAIVSGNLSYAG